jgi:uncharacterized membrane protein
VKTTRVVYAMTGLYALVLSGAAVVSYRAYQAPRFDNGNMVQAIWATAHGHFLRVTPSTLDVTQTSVRESIRLAGHVEPFLVLMVPLWWVWASPLMLLIVQAIAVSTGALPVCWLARKHLRDEQAAAIFALAYLLYPATQFNAFTKAVGFHPVSFAVPLILFAIWFLDEDRLVAFAACALLAVSTKEEIGLGVACLGIWYAVRPGRRLVGLATFAAGVAVSLVDFLVIIPHFSPTGSNPFADRYAGVGGSPGGILHKAVTDPGALISAMATGHKAVYLVLLLFPFLGLWLREPLLFLGAVPDLIINLLSSKNLQTTIGYQYTAGIIPFVVAASIFGAAKLRRPPSRIAPAVLVGAGLLAVIVSPVRLAAGDVAEARGGNPVHAAKAHALHLIPPGVPVSASNELGGFLSTRRFIYSFPAVGRAAWVIVDANDETEMPKTLYRDDIAKFRSSARWQLVYTSHGIAVLHRIGARRFG